MTCLADSQLPVRVQAAAALGALIEHDDVHAAMAPNAGRLMQELLKLSDETDLDVLSGTTSKIVDSFSEELLPFSVQFCTHLRDTYMRLLNEHLAGANVEEDPDQIDFNQNQEDKRALRIAARCLRTADNCDTVFAAVASLQTMYQVLSAAEGKPEMQAELEQVILPLVAYTLEKECVGAWSLAPPSCFCAWLTAPCRPLRRLPRPHRHAHLQPEAVRVAWSSAPRLR
jgi:activator of HSP90 ATPase